MGENEIRACGLWYSWTSSWGSHVCEQMEILIWIQGTQLSLVLPHQMRLSMWFDMNARDSEGYSDSKGIFQPAQKLLCSTVSSKIPKWYWWYLSWNGASELVVCPYRAWLPTLDGFDWLGWRKCRSLRLWRREAECYPDLDDIKSKDWIIVLINPNNQQGKNSC